VEWFLSTLKKNNKKNKNETHKKEQKFMHMKNKGLLENNPNFQQMG
jgi:hypothetical protein